MSKQPSYYAEKRREIIDITKVNEDGRTTIPAAIRKMLKLQPGVSRVKWIVDLNEVIVESS
jgi:bifunctional DNA-binding transcriptional regulator/antitoxin component of YhaV-PrlF toxin-antitoxin module